jgi:multidrug transporter EmrE-like cation transporter
MLKGKLTLKIFLFLILADVLETFHQFCFKKSALFEQDPSISGFYGLLLFFRTVFSSPFFWIGLLSLILMFIIWSTILSKIDLSVAVPIASFSYIFVALISILFLNETITLLRWIGIFLILTGVIVVSVSSRLKGSMVT